MECAHCNAETLHTLVYVGRLLASTTCNVCKTKVSHQADDLRVAYVKELKLFGQVLEPAETINYERESTSTFWSSRSGIEKSLTSNAYIQTYAQAKSIGDIIFDRQTKYNSILKINNYLGNQFLRVGDRVTVNIPNRATGEFFIVRNDWSINSSGLRQNFELLSFSGIYGQSSDSYFIIGSNKTADNKKLFY